MSSPSVPLRVAPFLSLLGLLCWATLQLGCAPRCKTAGDCGAGFVCTPDGLCMLANGGGGPGGGAAVDAGPPTCGGERFESRPTEANILIVLDRSCSMEEPIGAAGTKWQIATAAVRQVTAQHASTLRFGLQQFSRPSQQCSPGVIDVPVGAQNVTAISNAMPPNADGNSTPIGAALALARASGELDDAARANFVLLITDGMENCSGAPVNQVQGLFMGGVKTYTVGFGDAVDAARLTDMAVRGGTARNQAPRYFQADSPADLQAALTSITSGAVSCDYTLTSTPPNPSSLFVAVDGQFFPRDPTRTAGWDYQPQGNRVTLYGPACDVVAQRPGARVSIIYGCPDESLVERGPGGQLDAGVTGWGGDGGLPEIN